MSYPLPSSPMFQESHGISLTETLRLALKESEQQKKLLDDRARTILELQSQVSSLRDELRAVQNIELAGELSRQKTQIESLMKENAEKQFDIDDLRRTLQNLKAKVRSRGLEALLSSSPISVATSKGRKEIAVSPASIASGKALDQFDNLSDPVLDAPATENATDSAPIRKRFKSRYSSSPQAPPGAFGKGKPLSTQAFGSSGNESKQVNREEDAIEAIAEDGDHRHLMGKRKAVDNQREVLRPAAYDRLSELMSRPLPSASPLSRASGVQSRTEHSHISGGNDAELGQNSKLTRVLPSKINTLAANSDSVTESKSNQPLRSRPIHELHLANFKLNSAFIDHPDVTNGKPQWKDSHRGRSMHNYGSDLATEESDDMILVKFLGPGSEDRIKNLTAPARQNLVHEARTRLLSDFYGNKHMQFTRKQSPSGFWNTDMPGSQEENINKERGRLEEEDEVRHRYYIAVKGGGRWLFADE